MKFITMADGGKTERKVYRWWHITDLESREDGRFNLYVEQVLWNNTRFIKGGPSLFSAENYTYENSVNRNPSTRKDPRKQEQLLSYVIAPGAWISDVRGAVAVPKPGQFGLAPAALERKIKLAPASNDPEVQKSLFRNRELGEDKVTEVYKGDEISNVPGAHPWNPTGFRARHFAGFPTLLETASFISHNLGRVQMSAGLLVKDAYGGRSLGEVISGQKDHKPSFKAGVHISAATDFGLFLNGPFRQAGLNITSNSNELSDANLFFGGQSKAGIRIATDVEVAIDMLPARISQPPTIQWQLFDYTVKYTLSLLKQDEALPSSQKNSIFIQRTAQNETDQYEAVLFNGNGNRYPGEGFHSLDWKLGEKIQRWISAGLDSAEEKAQLDLEIIDDIAVSLGVVMPAAFSGTATISIKPRTNNFVFQGGSLDFSGQSTLKQKGISSTVKPAKNLRGINLKISDLKYVGPNNHYSVDFGEEEVDTDYCLQVETSWLTQKAVTEKRTNGFTIQFEEQDMTSNQNKTIDWLLVR